MHTANKLLWAAGLATFSLLIILFTHTQVTPRLLSEFHSSGFASKKYHRPQEPVWIEEKFLTYLPHSGLHNQRIALINAMVLAKALNRTLIMPELNIGKANFWHPSHKLAHHLDQCVGRNRTPANSLAAGCREYRRYSPVPVDTMFDLTPAYYSGVRLLQRLDMNLNYFKRFWSVPDDHVFYVDDFSRFSYRVYDSRQNTMPLLNYQERIDMEDLQNRPEPFLVFGSLFGSHRLALDRPELRWLWNYLFREMGMSYPAVTEQALQVVAKLGGPGEFASVHLRQGDGIFKTTMAQTMDVVRGNLTLATPNEEKSTEDDTTIEKLNKLREANRYEDLLNMCQTVKRTNNPRLHIIFMATDAPQPRLTLQYLFDEFVCLFSLSDFPNVMATTASLTATPLAPHNEQSTYPVRFGSLLLPLIDAEIASHASFFVGTPKSTFSKYIQHRNDRFQALYGQ
ncbi:hypothetical protein DFQ28_002671 [Apophysomyces sp. BC1034]|nr:hypothetical protein DFQ30_005065 [Apophysomyces sp. BC1015]KAG0179633.1 hypothetical protein DFQ29_001861 [Apophysomyces sp. BC1021]KAG0189973.1 hypothetical protein DFQ28_002671 [Apophysomyces sp. BC1034]